MPNKKEAAEIIGGILGNLKNFKETLDGLEEDEKEFDRLMAEAEKLPPRPAMSQEELFKKLAKKDSKS